MASSKRTKPAAGTPLTLPAQAAAPTHLTLRLRGKALPPPDLHQLLQAPVRLRDVSGAGDDDPFLPTGLLTVTAAWELADAQRGDAGATALDTTVAGGDLLLLALDDGALLITSGARLEAALRRNQPALEAEPGVWALDRLSLADGAAGPSRGMLGKALGAVVRRLYALSAGPAADDLLARARARLAGTGGAPAAELGLSWRGTQALMWAIEEKLDRPPGRLYRWSGAGTDPLAGQPFNTAAAQAAAQAPMLVFIHGTGSSTRGSFGDLAQGDTALWAALVQAFPGGIYGFEHRSLSESPITNALQLVQALPVGARVSLVTHSRGGLVGDLLCLRDFDAQIDAYRRSLPGLGPADGHTPQQLQQVVHELDDAHADQRKALRALAAALRERRPQVQRYVRVASPAQGTRLASANLDVFLSVLLHLLGTVPYLLGNPLYAAFRRMVIEIARHRCNPHLVPGIEAMLPDAPLATLLRSAPVQPGVQMALIAGDFDGANPLSRLGELFADRVFFDAGGNDLVVDTAAMLGGIAARASARVLLDRGSTVTHFRYFGNSASRRALHGWLSTTDPAALATLADFQPLPAPGQMPSAHGSAHGGAQRGGLGTASGAPTGTDAASAAEQPVLVLLPDFLGSGLRGPQGERLWCDPERLLDPRQDNGLAALAWPASGVEADAPLGAAYGALAQHLAGSHQVLPFAYDWRQPLDVLGQRLAEFLTGVLAQTAQPVRLLAHGLGGLVLRAAVHARPSTFNSLVQRPGARLLLLGVPHQGCHAMVANLLGLAALPRTLALLNAPPALAPALDLLGGLPGALALLPRQASVHDGLPVLADAGAASGLWQQAATWTTLKAHNQDPWFGDGLGATPSQAALDAGAWLWLQDGAAAPTLPAAVAAATVQVLGVAPRTPCGLRLEGGRLRLVGTAQGDGMVTWAASALDGVGPALYMPVPHGDLANAPAHFAALAELLASGSSAALPAAPPASRSAAAAGAPLASTTGAGAAAATSSTGAGAVAATSTTGAGAVAATSTAPAFDPPAPQQPAGPASALAALLGASPQGPLAPRARRRLAVSVKAMDLRFLDMPVLVGHYDNDTIAGPQRLIDSELLDGALSQRRSLGLYAGPLGSATVVLRTPNAQERLRASEAGAVVVGLGHYSGTLSLDNLTQAVRAGVLRYLMHRLDVYGPADAGNDPAAAPERPLAALLLGYNSSVSLSVAASLEALVRGTLEANARFAEATGSRLAVTRLNVVELYLDTAISAAYALRQVAARLAPLAARLDTQLDCASALVSGDGLRPRLHDNRSTGYWPQLSVTDADTPAPDDSLNSSAPAAPPPGRCASRLAYRYVGQRARAESLVQQRQPALVETLVRQQISNTRWSEDFGRLLFQQLVPHDFKDLVRQLQRSVLVVDDATANLPWEMLLAETPLPGDAAHGPADPDDGDRLPLAVRAALVRQFATGRFRRQVQNTTARQALVIGNPSVAGFAQHFPDPAQPQRRDPDPLADAETEARAVAGTLRALGYQVKQAIGADQTAQDVLARLYRQPYRVVHVSAHGVFELRHADGQLRSGVVLSDGLLITAAEINAMEAVPELVFLNCCHLGQMGQGGQTDAAGQQANRLAGSLARELIDIGVRCVIVAGWAVNDSLAQQFGQVFYSALLRDRLPFGDAVHLARRAIWQADRQDITWGAFQAYGDPGWLAEPRVDGASTASTTDAPYATLHELLDALAQQRATLARRTQRSSADERRAQADAVQAMLQQRCPPEWRADAALQSALGALWRDLGQFDLAQDALLAAVQAEDATGRVPIRDIEQLANVQSRRGEALARAHLQQHPGTPVTDADLPGLALARQAIARLGMLDQLLQPAHGSATGSPTPTPHAERAALRGGAHKRLAVVMATALCDGAARPAADQAALLQALHTALSQAVQAYGDGEGAPGEARFSVYHALNRLALQAFTPLDDTTRGQALATLDHCDKLMAPTGGGQPTVWAALMWPDAALVRQLLCGGLGAPGAAGEAALADVHGAYRQAVAHLLIRPGQLDSVLGQLDSLAAFAAALQAAATATAAAAGAGAGAGSTVGTAPQWLAVSQRLGNLCAALRPGG